MTTVRTENPFPNVPIPAGARLDDWMDEDTQTVALSGDAS